MTSPHKKEQNDHDDDNFLEPAFPIPTNLPAPRGPPETAEEYISLIRNESAKLPQILSAPRKNVTLNATGTKFKKRKRLPRPPSFAQLSHSQCKKLASWFANLQKSLIDFRDEKAATQNRYKPQQLIKTNPMLSVVLQMDHMSAVAALEYIDEILPRIHESDVDDHCAMSKIADQVVGDPKRACWIFCLLLLIETPLSANVAATMRSILRKVYAAHHGLDDATDRRLPALNLFSVILGTHFGQEESW